MSGEGIVGLTRAFMFAGSPSVLCSLWKVDVDGKATAVQTVVYQSLYASWLPSRLASFAFAVTFVLFWYLVLLVLQKRGIVYKV